MAKYVVNLTGSYGVGGSVRHIEADFMECANGAVLFYRDKLHNGTIAGQELVGGIPLSVVLNFGLEEKEGGD